MSSNCVYQKDVNVEVLKLVLATLSFILTPTIFVLILHVTSDMVCAKRAIPQLHSWNELLLFRVQLWIFSINRRGKPVRDCDIFFRFWVLISYLSMFRILSTSLLSCIRSSLNRTKRLIMEHLPGNWVAFDKIGEKSVRLISKEAFYTWL